MRKMSLLFLFAALFLQSSAQDQAEKQKLKLLVNDAFESLSPKMRQWFSDADDQHPAGDFDSSYANKKIKGLLSVSQQSEMGELFVVMMAYLKMVQKEAREDRKIARMSKERTLATKAKKIELDNKAIDEQMKEAGEKAKAAMDAAVTSLVAALISGNLQIAGASRTIAPIKPIVKIDSLRPKQPTVAKSSALSNHIDKLQKQLTLLKKSKL